MIGRLLTGSTDKKAKEEMAKKAGGKGPMNSGQQGRQPAHFENVATY